MIGFDDRGKEIINERVNQETGEDNDKIKKNEVINEKLIPKNEWIKTWSKMVWDGSNYLTKINNPLSAAFILAIRIQLKNLIMIHRLVYCPYRFRKSLCSWSGFERNG